MELHQLRYFLAIVDRGGFGRAARHCRVTQPTLSQQVRKLEESLGHRLFDRLGRRVELTEAGRALLPRARRIVAEADEVRGSLERDLLAGATRLAVGAIPTIAPYLLPPHLRALHRRFPDCELTVREDLTERLVEAVVEGELDLAITSTPIEHDLAEVEVVGREQLLVALPPGGGVGRRDGGAVSISDLRDAPTVVLHDVHCLGRQIQGFCTARRVRPRVTCRGSQLSTVLGLVGLGMGCSLVPEMCARAQPQRQGGVRFAPIERGAPMREIAVVRRRGRSRTRVGEWLAGAIAEALRSGAHSYPGAR